MAEFVCACCIVNTYVEKIVLCYSYVLP